MYRAAVKKIFIYAGAATLLSMTACGPAGPLVGLGPALDSFVGFLFLLALFLGGAWVVRSAARSPDGQAIAFTRWSGNRVHQMVRQSKGVSVKRPDPYEISFFAASQTVTRPLDCRL